MYYFLQTARLKSEIERVNEILVGLLRSLYLLPCPGEVSSGYIESCLIAQKCVYYFPHHFDQ